MPEHPIGNPAAVLMLLAIWAGCSGESGRGSASRLTPATTVGVANVTVKTIAKNLTVSSELVPFQQIEVYAKEAGYVRDLRVDYGSRVKKGDLMAVLEIPELEALIAQDAAAIQRAGDVVMQAQNEITRLKAQYNVAHLQYTRLKRVADTQRGLVAQQEVDDAQGRDLAAEAQVQVGESNLLGAKNLLDQARAKQKQDQVLFDYSRITAPFDGVVTQRYANLGTLMQAGTNSSTQAIPLVRLSQDDKFRLVIPVPESYVKYIRIGDPVRVRVPSLNRVFTGRVTRFSVDVAFATRTMHTEVDVFNPSRILLPGLYAEATLTLEHRNQALVVPIQAISQEAGQTRIFLVDANCQLQLRTIQTGLQTADEVEVLSGLNEGDRVVVSDRSGLKAGMEVRPVTVDVLQYHGANVQ